MVLKVPKWKNDPVAADAAHYIESGDLAALGRLKDVRPRPEWLGDLLAALGGYFPQEDGADTRAFQTAAALISPEELDAWWQQSPSFERMKLCTRLMRCDDAFWDVALRAARAYMDSAKWGAGWLVEIFGRDLLPNVIAALERGAQDGQFGCAHRQDSVETAVRVLGKEALPAVLCGLRDEWVHRQALGHLIDLDDGTHTALIRQGLEWGLTREPTEDLIGYTELAARWRLAEMADHLWPLLAHKSKQVREAAVRVLSRLGEAALPRAAEMLRHRKAEARLAAVGLLTALNTPAALELLRPVADQDSSGPVRDAARKALPREADAGPGGPREAILARARKNPLRIKGLPARWLNDNSLPPLHYTDGEPLDRDAVHYLLFRQARATKLEPDVEVQALYDLIDRRSSGDFALTLMKGFLAAGANLKERWAMLLACLFGDARVVPLLQSQIRAWEEGQQPKRAEDGVRAMALLGNDAALMGLDALVNHYRGKRPYLAAAAAEGLARAAEQRRLTPEELGDCVVPWLGFEPGNPRVVSWGKRRVEVRIGLDFKMHFTDLETGKPLKALPASAPESVQAELKEQSAWLKETVKAQLARLEGLMVRQHRWPAGRWRELFLSHPLLGPFAVRLVWGAFDDAGRLTVTFRALEDRSLTGADDQEVPPPPAGSVGIVHPLELDEGTRQAWQCHLADYEIEPPFPQLGRPVLQLPPERQGEKVSKDFAGVTVLAGTLRNRAEKLGWIRGAVSGGGGIRAYWKGFPAAGLDAVVGVQDMYIGAGWDAEVELGRVSFVRAGGKGRGYEYAPIDEDPRLVSFGEVPPILFAEVMGDLQKIAGSGGRTPVPQGGAGG
jgi:hypothetical protein